MVQPHGVPVSVIERTVVPRGPRRVSVVKTAARHFIGGRMIRSKTRLVGGPCHRDIQRPTALSSSAALHGMGIRRRIRQQIEEAGLCERVFCRGILRPRTRGLLSVPTRRVGCWPRFPKLLD